MTITRGRAWTCFVVNQLVCPGIGTIIAGKRIGFVQAVVMIAGFCMALTYGLMYINAAYKFTLDASATETQWKAMQPPVWMGLTGFAFCGIAWFWSLCSSIRTFHESRRRQPL